MSKASQFRDSLVENLRKELVGPFPLPGQEEEILSESPQHRYSAGILFPNRRVIDELEDVDPEMDESLLEASESLTSEEEDPKEEIKRAGGEEESGDSSYDETIQMSNSFYPSAIGLSFIVDSNSDGILVEPRAATYTQGATHDGNVIRKNWVRKPLDLPSVIVPIGGGGKINSWRNKPAENLELRAVWRKRGDGSYLITVSMLNTKVQSGKGSPKGEFCFFQTGFRVVDSYGNRVFKKYQTAVESSEDPDNALLELLYHKRRSYAVGHGCAAGWENEQNARAGSIFTETIPEFKIAPIQPRTAGGLELNMHFLAGMEGSGKPGDILKELSNLSDSYEKWISEKENSINSLPRESLKEQGKANLKQCRECLKRMQQGIELLQNDSLVMKAFMLANKVMVMQQYHSRRKKIGIKDPLPNLPETYIEDDVKVSNRGKWYAFQLAFILINLQSIVVSEDNTHAERELVDLIWFPTGGGKTEAYLGLSAFTILHRRLLNPSNSGSTVLMRYTLRLLTAQQFQRAASMICACEKIRREDPEALGTERITIGLWVGESLSPNKRAEARKSVNLLAERSWRVDNKFQILSCPWCGTEMDNPKKLGYVQGGNPRTVLFVCPRKGECNFSVRSMPLPISVIDEDIYDEPPTLVIGTVDKFAMLTWRKSAGAIFGLSNSGEIDPPALIIQDELHLISGPLGSMVGLYEGMIDQLCSWKGRPPKIIASTATIRRAEQQCRALYNRPTFQFPPPGLDASDSFFAVENEDAVGRVYLGVFASAAPSFVSAMTRTLASLLQGTKSLPLPEECDESLRDAYWTLVQYYNSLRELGRGVTLAETFVRDQIMAINSRLKIPKEKRRYINSIEELTSRRTAHEIPQILDRLENTYPKVEDGKWPIDTLLATNMISVGVDINRLGMMVVAGQPKTSSEYIQATSRVGRSENAPGLVVVVFGSARSRDRSHYEQFRTYHNSLYKYVEPTSVTPYALPVLKRALHAVLVSAVRHLGEIEEPGDFSDSRQEIQQLAENLIERCRKIAPDHADRFEEMLNELMKHWQKCGPVEWGGFGEQSEQLPLLFPSGTEPLDDWNEMSWETPSSMRNVDSECEGKVCQYYEAD